MSAGDTQVEPARSLRRLPSPPPLLLRTISVSWPSGCARVTQGPGSLGQGPGPHLHAGPCLRSADKEGDSPAQEAGRQPDAQTPLAVAAG